MQFVKFVKLREEKFGSVVFDTLKEKVYVTNETGSQILKLIEAGKNKAEIIAQLKSAYPAESATLEAEVLEFLSGLGKNNLIEAA